MRLNRHENFSTAFDPHILLVTPSKMNYTFQILNI